MIDNTAYLIKLLLIVGVVISYFQNKNTVAIAFLLLLAFWLGVEVITIQDNQWAYLLTQAATAQIQAALLGGAIGFSLMGFFIVASISFVDWYVDLTTRSKQENKVN